MNKRNTTLVALVLISLLALVVQGATAAGIRGVNTFTVSPDPVPAGQQVTLSINASMTSGDGTTYFCLYIPSTASTGTTSGNNANNTPDPITLTYYSGFTQNNANFSKTAQPDVTVQCPARSGQQSTLYKATGLPATATTFEGSATMTISSTATPGTYEWTLLLQEPGSGVNPLSTSHTIQAAVTDVYVSDSATCGGYGVVGYSCFQNLTDAYNVVTGSNKVVVVGTLTLATGGYTIAQTNTLEGQSGTAPTIKAAAGCTAGLTVNAATTVQNLTIDGTDCPGVTGLDVTGAATINNVTVQNFSAGVGVRLNNASASLSGSTIQGNQTGLSLAAWSTVNRNTVQNNTGDGISVTATGGTLQDNDILNNGGDGIQVPAGFSGTIQENHITGNSGYGVNFTATATGTPTITLNNIYGNSSGAFINGSGQYLGGNYLGDTASPSDLSGFKGALIGSPLTRSNPGIDASNVSQGVVADGSGGIVGSLTITNTSGSNLTFYVVDLVNDTPFGVGVDPYQNTQCSHYFDVFVGSDPSALGGNVTVQMPVDAGACQTTYVRAMCQSVATKPPVRWANSDSTTWQVTSSPGCDSTTNPTQVWGSIAANKLGGTGFVVVGQYSPTVIALKDVSATTTGSLPLVLSVLSVLAALALFWLRRIRARNSMG